MTRISRIQLAGINSGLDIHYDFGGGHPLLERRMPDLDLETAEDPVGVFTLLYDAQPVLLHFNGAASVDITPRSERVKVIEARYDGPWELPIVGAVSAPTAALVRPDGYVAWVGEGTDTGLRDALTRWFGSP